MGDYKADIALSCRKLRLSSNLAERAMTQQGETNQEYLCRLLEDEIAYRREVRITKLLNTAGFPQRYEFTQFNPREVHFPSSVTLEGLKSLDFYREGKNIVMYGGTGTGKTMLSICLGIEACQQEIPVKFYRTASLVNQLSEGKSSGTLSRLTKKLNKASILILDEFGYVPYDRTGSQLLFDYLSEIHGQKSIILNTNLEFSRWVNILYDEQMTAALVGRLMHHCHLILFPGGNNRLKESSLNETYQEIAAKGRTEGKQDE
ncbi:MAG: IS21-like element helper ATPase IstB [Lachnospiraceae bacterium]|nr:IS21-like element helper ATPase IstB [Lachnospiraceae bacterium]